MDSGEFRGTERYQVKWRLGAGGFGVVYEVHDRDSNAQLALKTLQQLNAETLYRFKREFRALAGVHHRNLVALHDLVAAADGSSWFFTMELVDGVDFLTHVRGANRRAGLAGGGGGGGGDTATCSTQLADPGADATLPVSEDPQTTDARGGAGAAAKARAEQAAAAADETRLRLALRQLAEGVAALHAAGRLHRDIKPSNVLVAKDGRVVLLDFGLVKETEADETTQSVTGSAPYMAPEQAAGDHVTEAADWYAVGVMIYEALTGRWPYEGTPLKILLDKQQRDPPPPATHAPDAPADLCRLCEALLARAPAARPTGAEVLARLDQGQSADAAPVQRSREPMAAGRFDESFVGREAELQALHQAFDATRQGRRPVAVHLQGASGMGKSALLQRFVAELSADSQRAVVLCGRCYERESVPFKALDAVIDALCHYLRGLDRTAAGDLMPRHVRALARLFPVLDRVEAVADAPPVDIVDPHDLRRRAFSALSDLLGSIAERGRLIVCIDDLQWGDLDSAALLSELFRREPPRLLLVLSYRSEERQRNPILVELLEAHPLAIDDTRTVQLDALSQQVAAELAARLLPGDPAGPGLADAVAAEAGGSPLFVAMLARRAADREAADREQTISLEALIREQIHQLPEAARRLVEAVAVAGQPIDGDVAADAAGLTSERADCLALLQHHRLVRSCGGRSGAPAGEIEPFHDRIREAVVGHLDAEHLRACHAALADRLASAGTDVDPERLAHHFHAAGERQRAAAHAVRAAGAAAEKLAFDQAARLYRLALETGSFDRAEQSALQRRLGEQLSNAGRCTEASAAFVAAAEGRTGAELIDLLRRAAEHMLFAGRVDEGLALLRDVLAELGMKLPNTYRGTLLSILARRAHLRLRGLGFEPRPEAEIPAEDLLRIDACWSTMLGLLLLDPLRSVDYGCRHLLAALRAGEPGRVARGLAMEACCITHSSGRSLAVERSTRLLETSRDLAEKHDDFDALMWVVGTRGSTTFYQGRFKAAKARNREALEQAARQSGVSWGIMASRMMFIWSLYYTGDLAELRRCVDDWTQQARARGDQMSSMLFATGRGITTWLGADQPDRARQVHRELQAQWRPDGFYIPDSFLIVAEVLMGLYRGTREAHRVVEDSWAPLKKHHYISSALHRFEWTHMRAAAALTAFTDPDTPESERSGLLAQAHKWGRRLSREALPPSAATALLVEAAVAHGRAQLELAVERLTAAEAALAEHDMALFAAAARRRRGEIVGGDEGAALVTEADAKFGAQNIVRPDRFAAMLAPGFGPPA